MKEDYGGPFIAALGKQAQWWHNAEELVGSYLEV